jgi:DNA polymerase-1
MQFKVLQTDQEVEIFIQEANEAGKPVALDLETACQVLDCTDEKCKHALDPATAHITEVTLSARPDIGVLIRGGHVPFLQKLKTPLVLHNHKFDFKMLHAKGIDLRDREVFDTMLVHHLIDEDAPHDLDSLIQAEFKDDYKAQFWSKYKRYEDAAWEDKVEYATKDAVYTLRLRERLSAKAAAQGIPDSLIEHVHRLARTLLDTEIRGIAVDLDFTVQMGSELKGAIEGTERELRRLGGFACELVELDLWMKEVEKRKTPKGRLPVPKPEFSFGSGQQVQALLYDQLKLPLQISEKTKNPTVDDAALEELESKHPLIPKLRELRKFSKMYTAFIEGVMVQVKDGRIYPSFNVNGTKTGRISHSEPNMGQMPSKGEWAKIRGIFVPDPGYKLITCDYSQLEVCIAAHYSQDEKLLEIIHEGKSQHDITAEGLKIERALAKTINFASQYLCSPRKYEQLLNVGPKQAQILWNQYWHTYKGLKKFIDWCIGELDAGRPIVNPFGRARHFPGFSRPTWSDPQTGRFCKEDRQCFNAIIQGTGADITSRAAYLVDDRLKSLGAGYMWFTVHDELIACVREDAASAARDTIQSAMVTVGEEIGLRVPLSVECSQPLDRWQK